jgi:hypothetical protein
MQIALSIPDSLPLARLLQRVKEFEESLKAEATVLASPQTSLPTEKASVDVLQTMAQMAQPMGISDLSHHFDEYTRRVISDEIAP